MAGAQPQDGSEQASVEEVAANMLAIIRKRSFLDFRPKASNIIRAGRRESSVRSSGSPGGVFWFCRPVKQESRR